MKKLSTSLLFVFLLTLANAQSKWLAVYDNPDMNLTDIEYGSLLTGYAIGDKGVVLKTDDMGLNWRNVGKPELGDLQLLEVVNDDTIFVASKTKIYRSFNGGQDWKLIYEGEEYNSMELYKEVDEGKPYPGLCVAGNNGLLMRSIDFGDHFEKKEIWRYHKHADVLHGFFGHQKSYDKDTIAYYQLVGNDTLLGTRDNFRTMVIKIKKGETALYRGLIYLAPGVQRMQTINKQYHMQEAVVFGLNGLAFYDFGNYLGFDKPMTTNTTNTLYDGDRYSVHSINDTLTEDGHLARSFAVGDNGTLLFWNGQINASGIWPKGTMTLATDVPKVNYRGATRAVSKEDQFKFLFAACGEGVIIQRNYNGLTFPGVGVKEANAFYLNLYPNPTQGESRLYIQPAMAGNFDIKVFNSLGQLVQQESLSLGTNGYYHVLQNLTGSGIYHVIVSGAGGQKVLKLVKN